MPFNNIFNNPFSSSRNFQEPALEEDQDVYLQPVPQAQPVQPAPSHFYYQDSISSATYESQPVQQAAYWTQPAEAVPAHAYYQDTISQAEQYPAAYVGNAANISSRDAAVNRNQKGVNKHLDEISARIDAELQKEDRDFEKLQTMIYSVIMLMMRLSAKTDRENILDIQIKVKNQAREIQATYNTWKGMTITAVSSSVSIGAGVMGLTPFMPAAMIAAESARNCANAATSVASAGTGIGGFGSIESQHNESKRGFSQIIQKQTQDTEEERKSAEHTKRDHLKTAKAARDEFDRSRHEARRTTLS